MNKRYIIVVFGALIVIAVAIILMNITYDPLDDFNGPSHIPDNYNLSRNNTTENSTYLLYKGSARINFFLVGAIRDQNKTVLNSIKSSFNNSTTQNANLHILEDKINVNDHQVTLKGRK